MPFIQRLEIRLNDVDIIRICNMCEKAKHAPKLQQTIFEVK